MRPKSRILLVDDDQGVRSAMRAGLARAGYDVAECGDGLAALDFVERERVALIVLDVEMPRMDGWKTLSALRARRCLQPVLMVTHVDDVDSKVRGLEIGADDYIGKPFVLEELLARVRALLRRAPVATGTPRELQFGPCNVDLGKRNALRDGESIRLTRIECALLEVLAAHAGKAVSREAIFKTVWEGKVGVPHTLDTHIWRLRRKLGDTGPEPRWILNHPGVGFSLAAETLVPKR